MSLAPIWLHARADRRLRMGHLWLYSNEVDTQRSPLASFQPGQQAVVMNHQGKALGVAIINPNTLICGRLVSHDARILLNKSLLVHRLNIALKLRQTCFDKPYYRLVYGDSDLLPGLIVDRFDDICVVQITTAGMELLRSDIMDALVKVIRPRGVLIKNTSAVREMEGLTRYVEVGYGVVPERITLQENNTLFWAPLHEGQKTGWFYDHRLARHKMQRYAQGQRVLDVFSYIGGWGIQALKAGASQLVNIDSSELALATLDDNIQLNQFKDKHVNLKGNAVDQMNGLIAAKEKFDIVILDPPAFIKRRKDVNAGERAYRNMNELAIRLLAKEGLLISASCSMHLPRQSLVDIVRGAGRHIGRFTQIIEQYGQGPDHPVHPAIPETDYLKSLFVRSLQL